MYNLLYVFVACDLNMRVITSREGIFNCGLLVKMSHKTILLLNMRIVYRLYSHINTNYSTKYIKKLLDSINIKIISELLEKPTISSLALSKTRYSIIYTSKKKS